VEDTIINLDGTVANPQTYNEAGDYGLVIRGLQCCGEGVSLTIQPTIWNQIKYDSSQDPLDSSQPFDPEVNRPCTINKVCIYNSNGVKFNGVNFGWPGSVQTSTSPLSMGFT